jgi:hypothetical protein
VRPSQGKKFECTLWGEVLTLVSTPGVASFVLELLFECFDGGGSIGRAIEVVLARFSDAPPSSPRIKASALADHLPTVEPDEDSKPTQINPTTSS